MKLLSVLVCVENDLFRGTIRSVLAHAGCTVEEANNVFFIVI